MILSLIKIQIFFLSLMYAVHKILSKADKLVFALMFGFVTFASRAFYEHKFLLCMFSNKSIY